MQSLTIDQLRDIEGQDGFWRGLGCGLSLANVVFNPMAKVMLRYSIALAVSACGAAFA